MRSRADQLQAALLLAGCLVVPLMVTPAERDVFALTKLATLQIIAILGMLLLGMQRIGDGWRTKLAPSPIDTAVIAFVLLNTAACVFSVDPLQSLHGEEFQHQGLLSVLLYVAFFYLAYTSMTDDRRVALLFASVAAGAIVVAAYAVLQGARLDPIWDYPQYGRTFSTIGQSNALAAYLVTAIAVSAALMARARSTISLTLAILAIATIGTALASTGSRGGYIGALAAVAVLTVPLAGDLKLKPRGILGGLGILTLVVLAVTPVRESAVAAWRRGVAVGDLREWSVQRHLDLWVVASAIAWDHPLLGTGQETFPELFPQYSEAILGRDSLAVDFAGLRAESPHNVYLAIAAGAGLPALATYLAVIAGVVLTVARAIRSCRRGWRRAALAAVLAAVAGHVVTDIFMTADVTSSWLFWVLMGVGVGIGREDRQRHTLDGDGPLSAH